MTWRARKTLIIASRFYLGHRKYRRRKQVHSSLNKDTDLQCILVRSQEPQKWCVSRSFRVCSRKTEAERSRVVLNFQSRNKEKKKKTNADSDLSVQLLNRRSFESRLCGITRGHWITREIKLSEMCALLMKEQFKKRLVWQLYQELLYYSLSLDV